MADVRIPSQTATAAQLGRAAATPRPEAVRAAQRAFFEAALGQPNAAAPVKKADVAAAATTTPAARASFTASPSTASSAEPSRFARPGSLIDIKV